MPRVSAIIPTYNCAEYIVEAIESILAQTYQDLEIIVIDDGSTDNTRQLLAPYQDRIIYLYQENQGESVARNRGIRLARGEYVAFLDADDWWVPTKLERQVAILDAQPAAVLAYSYSFAVDRDGKPVEFRGSNRLGQGEAGLFSVFERLVFTNFIANVNTVTVRRSALWQTNLFDPAIRWGEDWDLWLQLALKGPFVFVPESLACYRMRKPSRRLQIEASDEFVRQSETILRKTFAALPEDQTDLLRLQPQAFGALYHRSAMYNFELANVDRGAHYVEQAVQADPDLVKDGSTFARHIADEGFRIAHEKGDLNEGVAFVRRVFDHLPPEAANLRVYRADALSGIYATAAFSQFEQGNRRATLQHVIRSIRYHPSGTRRGLLSIGAQALIGGKPWARLRRPHRTGNAT
ncbi:MAG: glycosyltransferase [Anaerolineae bacterium]|nr:glycosyltransferase [Anaerolineae bacterium]